MKKLFLLFALLSSLAYAAACEGTAEMELPAVSEGEEHTGELVLVRMWIVEGEGDIYVGTVPPTDYSLQESLDTALTVAESLAGEEAECDVLLRIDDESEYVQGPSGGAAFSILAYFLLTGEEMRDDVAITGAVNKEGIVMPVGGVYEKVLTARSAGKEYFLTPVQSFEEKMMLESVDGITVYEVRDVEEALDFLLEGRIPETKPLNLTVKPLPELAPYGGKDTPGFRRVSEGIIEREDEAVRGIEDEQLREYLLEKTGQQKELIEMGYYYSAANDAFLNYILADSILQVDNPDVEGKKEEVSGCLESVERPILTYENSEWFMGAEARIKRAENQLETYGDLGGGTKEERYFAVYQLDYALAWCQAAKDMYGIARETGGIPMDERVLRGHADTLINISGNYSEIENSENYRNGMELYEDGAYAGAVYELVYALSFENKNLALIAGANESNVNEINEGERESLWGNVFKAHSQYLLETGDVGSAYGVAVFAREMESIARAIEENKKEPGIVVELPGQEANATAEEEPECVCPECPEPVCAGGYLFLVLPFFIKNLVKKK
ncbi:MAG: S16 family serine protease [Candidatus Micrarchaeia archaeon]